MLYIPIAMPALAILLALIFLIVVLPVWAIVDILCRPAAAFVRNGYSKAVWLVILVGMELAATGLHFLRLVAIGLALNYLVRVRPQLRRTGLL